MGMEQRVEFDPGSNPRWTNVAALLNVSEQQVANVRFAAVKKLSEQIREDGLPADVFPELSNDEV